MGSPYKDPKNRTPNVGKLPCSQSQVWSTDIPQNGKSCSCNVPPSWTGNSQPGGRLDAHEILAVSLVRSPKDHRNTRILQTKAFWNPPVWRALEPECRTPMFLWSFGPLVDPPRTPREADGAGEAVPAVLADGGAWAVPNHMSHQSRGTRGLL